MVISGMGSQLGVMRKNPAPAALLPTLLPEIVTVRMMGKAGNQDGGGVGKEFSGVKSGYLSFI